MIFIHLGLAHLAVYNRNEVLEVLELHLPKGSNAKQFGKEVALTWSCSVDLKKQINENGERKKN